MMRNSLKHLQHWLQVSFVMGELRFHYLVVANINPMEGKKNQNKDLFL
jgi:hypothetical protein